MLDVSKETHIEFLRAAVAHLQTKLVEERKKNQELDLAKKLDEEICQALAEELLILRKKFFKPGREKQNKSGPKSSVDRKNIPHNRPPEECPEPESVELVSEEVTHKIVDSSCSCSGDLAKMKGGFESSAAPRS